MASTPSNRLKLTPSNSPFLPRPSRSPMRARSFHDSRLSLKRVVGTTCSSPTGFDTVGSSFAYIAGGAVVVVDVRGESYSQRFFRARPTAVPIYAISPVPHAPSTPNSTPKANDSRNRVAASSRDSIYDSPSWAESPTSKTWTSRERIKAATCVSLSRDGRFLAVGETGYAPRVLIYSLQDSSSDTPLVSISEHAFGVRAVAWSPDNKYLASLGMANDGFLYLWKVDPRTGAAKLFQQNRCTSYVHGMIWLGTNLITFGVRHVKVWRVEDGPSTSPVKRNFGGESSITVQPVQKTLPGRNILLGSLLDACFSCAAAIDDNRAVICTEAGDVCLLDDTSGQMKLTRMATVETAISCVALKGRTAHISGKSGLAATIDVEAILECRSDVVTGTRPVSRGLLAMGYLDNNLVTIDSRRSIDIWKVDYTPGLSSPESTPIQIPGQGDPVLGVEPLSRPNGFDASFYTWSGSGKVLLWDLDGRIKSSFDVPIEDAYTGNECDPDNQLCVVRASKSGKIFAAADKLGVLRILDSETKDCLMETKAHSCDCQVISILEDDTKLVVATCGRDRTAQLFHKTSSGSFELFQTLEFAAKVVQVLLTSDDKVITCSFDRTLQVHDLVSKDGEPDAIAAIPLRVISLKASPSSMAMAPDCKSVYVSLLDRSVCQYEISTGRLMSSFKCTDEGGMDAVVLDSLVYGSQTIPTEQTFLLGLSNTDKSVRIYDPQSGSFLDREWGHTEAINGVVLIDEEDVGRKVVSVGSDGTIMTWALDFQEVMTGSMSRDPSPAKDSMFASRPPLRRVLSKAELAEFQRPSPSAGRRSPPRTLHRRTSRYNLTPSVTRTPIAAMPASPSSTLVEETPSRRASSGSRSRSPPPISPKSRVSRRPSLPALRTTPPAPTTARKKSSAINLRASYGFGSLNMATEQTCRQLRAYRKKLSSSDPITSDALAELDTELRLTAAALGDRATRTKQAVSETALKGLLDQYSERLVSMLDEKLRLRLDKEKDEEIPSVAGSTDEEQEGNQADLPNERSRTESG
ncbi:WD40 repeat-like protein [Pleurostoma richardsiae]|uniref:WD40 repeat-like protein n=1 Tax=Pleurostoma richardsiae TaxID=41990 RepID=A0AA38RVW4_9PEZI|nr:WD40 repeat-like protein [Pleurostoma richardsiae]